MNKLYYVNVRPDGRLQRAGSFPTLPSDVDAIADLLRQRQKLVLYFHGGLVSEESGIATAEQLLPTFDDGATRHAVFMIWETGFVETIRANAVKIIGSTFFGKLRDIVFSKALKHLGIADGKGVETDVSPDAVPAMIADRAETEKATAVARGGAAVLTEADLDDMSEFIKADVEADIMAADAELTASLQADDETNALIQENARDTDVGSQKAVFSSIKLVTAAAKVVFSVIRRFISHRDHGLHATVVEEILREVYVANFGAAVWQSMKDSAKAMWTSNDGGAEDDLFGGRFLLDKIVAVQKETGLKVDLVGHSAGAIAILEMLEAADSLGLQANHIVFLAPACTFEALSAKLQTHKDSFKSFRLFAMHDELEAKDTLIKAVPALYPSSLLYFISGVLEDDSDKPIAGMARYTSGKKPYVGHPFDDLGQFLNVMGADRYVVAITDAPGNDGLRCDSTSHGGFAAAAQTNGSLKFIATN